LGLLALVKLQGLTPKHGSQLRSHETCANRETGKVITPARKTLGILLQEKNPESQILGLGFA
jgi:hypothetical protein